MRKKKKGVRAGDIAFNAFLYAFAGITLLIVLYPLYFILIASFSDPTLVTNGEVLLWPKGLNVDGYIELGKRADFWIGYRNTIAYTVLGVLVGLAVNVPVAYAFSRKDLVGRRLLNAYYMFTMFFNGGLIPTYTVILNFGLYDSFWVLILPFSVSVYNIIVARMFFSTRDFGPKYIPEGFGDKIILPASTSDAQKLELAKVAEEYAVPPYPTVLHTSEELDEMTMLATDIISYVETTGARWVYEGGIEEEWDDYVAQLNQMGLERLMEIRQAALDRYYGKAAE